MRKFKELFTESFDQTSLVPLALKWLKNKFPEDEYGFTFKHVPNVTNTTKTYSVSVDDNEFEIQGRIFDANNTGKEDRGDVVQFKIVATQEDEDQPTF